MDHGHDKTISFRVSMNSMASSSRQPPDLLDVDNKDTTTVATKDVTVDEDDEKSLSHSEYSDSDDSADLYAADNDESSRIHENEMEDIEDEWLDEDIIESSKLIYNIIFLLCSSSIIVSIVTVYYSRKHAGEEFHMAYEDVARDILDVVKARSQNVGNVVKSVGRTITSSAGPDANWPFYTPDNLQAISEDFMEFGNNSELVYSPIVTEEELEEWEYYSNFYQSKITQSTDYPYKIPSFVYSRDDGGDIVHNQTGPYSPVWAMLPLPTDYRSTLKVNYNLLSNKLLVNPIRASYLSQSSVLSDLAYPDQLYGFGFFEGDEVGTYNPVSVTVQPVFNDLEKTEVVAHVFATLPWIFYLEDTVAHEMDQLFCVIENSCSGAAYTYVLTGNKEVHFYGMGDLHATRFDDFVESEVLSSYGFWDSSSSSSNSTTGDESSSNQQFVTCNVTMHIYPTAAMNWRYTTNPAVTHSLALMFFVFFLVGIAILTHHRITDANLRDTQMQGKRSKEIIASLFPEAIREKLFDVQGEVNVDKLGLFNHEAQKAVQQSGKSDEDKVQDLWGTRENYGDVYKNCTVVVADICGFSAWSASRDPSEIFTLLEAAFSNFDAIAKRRGVYKVETVGDAYVAVAGLPNPRKDHALAAAKFARDALNDFIELSNKLEISLGPDTSELGMRFGMASGSVLAGVLRGERARFQVFGATVSKCTKLEEAGQPDRIHIAKGTADLIKKSGFGNWVRARGAGDKRKKGDTYWLLPKRAVKQTASSRNLMGDLSASSNLHNSFYNSFHVNHGSLSTNSQPLDVSETIASSMRGSERRMSNPGRRMSNSLHRAPILAPMSDSSSQIFKARGSVKGRRRSSLHMVPEARQSQSTLAKIERLVFWNSETLLGVLKHVAARGAAGGRRRLYKEDMQKLETQLSDNSILQEGQEPISMPSKPVDLSTVDSSAYSISQTVEAQLLDYVSTISTLYRKMNPYSNFEHASHATMHMQKLLKRMDVSSIGARGISSDPLVQFAMLLGTLISAVDHRGISNDDLGRELVYMKDMYGGRSMAEQNAFSMAWQALMGSEYYELRRCIYVDEQDMRLFRSVLIHCVLARDLVDEGLNALRNNRWDNAFLRPNEESSSEETANLKATAVIEHMAKGAAIAHTHMHWHVYCKWSQCLFFEQRAAFTDRRSEYDPTPKWYDNELAAFDRVSIPLAKKFLEIRLLSSGEEYLENVASNRKEWETLGSGIMANMVDKFTSQYSPTKKRRKSTVKLDLKAVRWQPKDTDAAASGDECENRSLDPALGFTAREDSSKTSFEGEIV